MDLFGSVRDEWIDRDLPTWLGANGIYEGVAGTVGRAMQEEEVYIVTTKQVGAAACWEGGVLGRRWHACVCVCTCAQARVPSCVGGCIPVLVCVRRECVCIVWSSISKGHTWVAVLCWVHARNLTHKGCC